MALLLNHNGTSVKRKPILEGDLENACSMQRFKEWHIYFICKQFGDSFLILDHTEFLPPTKESAPSQAKPIQFLRAWPNAVNSYAILSSKICAFITFITGFNY